jgi:cytochrome c peroxidase
MSPDGKVWILTIALVFAPGRAAFGAASCPEHLAFLRSNCALWQSSVLPPKIPAARGNAYADRDDAAALGMKIFYDNRFSKPGSGVACANCHDPEHSFSETKPRSNTIKEIDRHPPDLIDAPWYAHSHFWDGKVDNLWSAPLFTFEQADEMGSNRLHVVHTLSAIYKIRYEKIFGEIPDLSDTNRFPSSGKPGTAEFDRMSREDKLLVDQIYANIGKALEAYIRKLAAGRSSFDDFMAGSAASLSPAAQRGMIAFTSHGCQDCHSGPTFSDERFHNLGLPTAVGHNVDPGRALGVRMARDWQFASSSRFADRTPPAASAAHEEGNTRGAFRTPSLRNVARTAPYGHDGSLETLDRAIAAHAKILPSHAPPDAQETGDLIEFLRSLSGRPPSPPWNYWPGG